MSVTRSPATTWIVLALIAAAIYWFWPAAEDPANAAYWSAAQSGSETPWTSPDGWSEMGVDFDFTSTSEEEESPAAQAMPAPLVAEGPVVDESALRFFARQGDTARYEAEVARLRALYPDWEPPVDPLAVPVVVDTEGERMWELYSEGRYAEVRAAIAERRTREPGWAPPDTLIELLEIGESRDQLIAASESGQYETVIRIGASTPALRVCSELDVMWRIAEAFARTDRADRATAAYAYLLQNCDEPAARFATMQKALAELPPAEFDQLWQFERTNAAGVPEFDEIRTAVARNAVALGGEDVAFVLSFEDRTRMEEIAREGPGAADAILLGWYHYLRDEVTESEQWFRLAHERESSAESAEGLTLSLIALGEPEEAEDVAYPWRETSENMLGVYLAAVAELLAQDPAPELTRIVLARIVETTAEAEDAVTARQLGWYAYGFDQIITAEEWFVTALQWDPTDEEAAYGVALSRQRLGDTAGLAAIIAEWGPRSTRIRLIGQPGSAAAQPPAAVQVPAAPAVVQPVAVAPVAVAPVAAAPVAAAPAAQVAAQPAASSGGGVSSAGCSNNVHPETLSPGAALDRGWCLMDLERSVEAAAVFEVALRSSATATRRDAAYGAALAYLRAGLTDRAAVAITQAEQSQPRVREVQAAILAQRAVAAYADGRYREAILALDERARIVDGEQNDLMMIRGYSHLELGQFMQARAIFEAVAATGFPDAIQALSNVENLSTIPMVPAR